MYEQRMSAWWCGMIAGAGLVVSMGSVVGAQDPAAAVPAEPASPPAQTAPVQAPAPLAEAAQQRAQKEADARTRITGTRWAIEWTPVGAGEKAKSQKDTVSFDDRQITSERLSKAGYPASNYTLTVQDDGVIIWETMQTKDGEGVAFWRGELHGTAMRGVLSKHPLSGESEDYTITGEQAKGSASGAKTAAPAVSTGAPASSDSATSDTGTKAPKNAKKSKKKGS